VRVDIVLFDGFDELDAVGPFEVLGNAERAGADLHPRLVTREPRAVVTGSHRLAVVPDAVFTPGDAELVVVPGGSWVARSAVGVWGEVQRGDWLAPLAAAAAAGAVMASVCTGAMLLAHAGVIGGRRATTHHDAWADLAATGATLVTDRVVDDGDLVTCGGVTSGLDLTLWLVERFSGAPLADAIAAAMAYERRAPGPPAG